MAEKEQDKTFIAGSSAQLEPSSASGEKDVSAYITDEQQLRIARSVRIVQSPPPPAFNGDPQFHLVTGLYGLPLFNIFALHLSLIHI